MGAERVRVNDPYVVHESIDDEVIVLNLATGDYYNLRDVAAEIWRFIQRTASVDEIVEGIVQRYSSARDATERAVRGFVQELRAETLVVLDAVRAPAVTTGDAVAGGPMLHAALPFSWPRLEKFTDLRYLLVR